MPEEDVTNQAAMRPPTASKQDQDPTAPYVMPPAEALLPVLAGYNVLAMIGRGGMGRVYKAEQRALGRLVAVKMLVDAGDDMLIARFHAESQAVARLQHPNIAQVFETGQAQGQPFLVLEYLAGGSLAQHIAGKPQPPLDAARLLETLARAMEHCHQHGIIHRDLKPGNVLLAADGIAKITDFGLAKRLEDDAKLTRTGDILGTPSYMAPEQASGVTSQLGPGVDIYALGAVLFELLTGRPPFQGPDTMQTLMLVLTSEPVPPSRLLPKLPRDLETICLKCLEKSPRKRYLSAALLAADLRRFIDGRPILARPLRTWERVYKWAKRRPVAALLVFVLFIGVITLAAGFVHIRAANLRLQQSLNETEDSLIVARRAIDGMLVRLSDQLAPFPQSEQLRRESLEDARKLYEKLGEIRPNSRAGVLQAAEVQGKLGEIYSELGRLDDAEASYRKSLALHTELKTQEPDDPDHRRGRANMLGNLANVEQKIGHGEQMETLARAALVEMAPLLDDADTATLRSASNIHSTLAIALRINKKLTEAVREDEAALALRKEWLAKDPQSTEAKVALASSLSNWATNMLISNRPDEAVAPLTEAEKLLAGQTSPRQRFYVGQFQANRAIAYELLKKEHEAEMTHAAAIATLLALVADYSAVPGYRHLLAKEHMNLARYFWPKGQNEKALDHLRIASPLLQALVQQNPDNQWFKKDLDLCRKITGFVEEDLAAAKKGKS